MKKKILIVAANFYTDFCDKLINSAKKELINFKKVDIIKVPGVFEIPVTISRKIKKYDGVVALGCVIKGETPHFDLISRSTFDAIIRISVDYNKPITNGIITCLNMRQAIQRSSISQNSKKNNKGKEAADALVALLKNEPKNS